MDESIKFVSPLFLGVLGLGYKRIAKSLGYKEYKYLTLNKRGHLAEKAIDYKPT
jgi:hypothetical protein